MTHSVRRHLRLAVDQYDASIRRFIPAYQEMLERAAAEVAAVRPRRVVDIGAGTGGLAEVLLRHPQVGRVELLDVDPEMLQRARHRLAAQADRTVFTEGSYDDPLPSCDALATALALHHMPGIEVKEELFARAFAALPSGGVLVNADVNMPAEAKESDRLFRYWVDHMVASGIGEQRAWQHLDEWAEEDNYLPLEAELDALERVGFAARRVWSAGPINVVVARKVRGFSGQRPAAQAPGE